MFYSPPPVVCPPAWLPTLLSLSPHPPYPGMGTGKVVALGSPFPRGQDGHWLGEHIAHRGRLFPPLSLPEAGAWLPLAPTRARTLLRPRPWAPSEDSLTGHRVPDPCSPGRGEGAASRGQLKEPFPEPGLAAGRAKTTGVPSSKVFSSQTRGPAVDIHSHSAARPCSWQLWWERL